nr:MAG TPA: hypothetical protein [Caudoviricetes sp.]
MLLFTYPNKDRLDERDCINLLTDRACPRRA